MRNLHSLILAFVLLLGIASVQADIVKMKDGTTHEGKITLQTPDLIKIEVSITDKIKETKTLGMVDVSEVVKTAPDDALFSEIQTMVPTTSMVTADQYRSMLTTGPEAFLSSFAGSQHKDKVEAIKKTLEEELDQVERGSIKLEGKWYTPQDRSDFPKMIEAQIVLFRMKNNARGGRYLNLISAMRDYETLEENYFGTPAFAEAAAIAQQILPNLGNQVKGLRRDVDVKNAEWEASKNALNVEDRTRVEAARANEEAQFAAAVSADKKAKITWTRVNPRSASELDSYLKFAGSEYTRIKAFDPALLKEMGEALVEVDKMIQKGDLERARANLSVASAMPVSTSGAAKKSSGSSKSSSTYAGALSAKISAADAERKAIAKAEVDAKKSASLTADLKDSRTTPTGLLDATSNATQTEATPETGEAPKNDVDDFDLLAKTQVKKAEEEKKTTPTKKSSSKSSSSKAKAEPRTPPPVADTPFPFQWIGIGLAVLAVAAVVILKVLGIGGKKEGEE